MITHVLPRPHTRRLPQGTTAQGQAAVLAPRRLRSSRSGCLFVKTSAVFWSGWRQAFAAPEQERAGEEERDLCTLLRPQQWTSPWGRRCHRVVGGVHGGGSCLSARKGHCYTVRTNYTVGIGSQELPGRTVATDAQHTRHKKVKLYLLTYQLNISLAVKLLNTSTLSSTATQATLLYSLPLCFY